MAHRSPRVVGLTGYAGSGKDTAAAGLIAAGYRPMAFADGVRELALAVDPWILVPLLTPEPMRLSLLVAKRGWHWAKTNVPEVRAILQNIGKGVRDLVGSDSWVAAMGARWLAAGRPDVVITDVRYPNEAAWVRRLGGFVIRIERPGVGPANDHESETLVDAIRPDTGFINDGTPEQLQQEVARVVEAYWTTPVPGLPF